MPKTIVLLHEWQEDADESKKPVPQIDYQAEYVVKLSEKKEQEEREKAAKGEPAPESLITWIFQDDFIPRARITKDRVYSIMTDYLGTPAEAYDDSGILVWKRELDINGNVMPAGKDRYGRTMEDIGEKNFIPFRFQGQYEDEETGLYDNRFRYYNPETGQYTQQDPIGLAGGNPTLYGYVYDTLGEIDPFGLTWKDILDSGLGHHIFPRAIAKKLGIVELSDELSIAWFPNNSANTGELHQLLHRVLSDKGVPYHGSKYTGNLEEFWKLAEEAYDGIDTKGYLKLPKTQNTKIYRNLTPKEALLKIKELYENGDLPTRCR